MTDCGTPSPITGGSVLTSGPYANGSYAVYTCTSGYVMSGTAYIECMNGTWSVDLPACSKQDYNHVYNYITDNHDDIPSWLLWMFAVIAGLLILLLIACVFAWCLQCLGCFGRGALFGEPNPRGSPCMCCKRQSYETTHRSCRTFPRKYEYDEEGRRYHLDDHDVPCYYEHKNKTRGKVVHYGIDDSPEGSTPRPTFVHAVNEVIVEKRQQPAKEIQAWKPHANPVRNINTSTK